MAENSNIGGSGSRQVGAVHIDMTLKGAEQVKAGMQEAAGVAQRSGQEASAAVTAAANTADSATAKLADNLTKRLATISGLMIAAREAFALGKEIGQTLVSGEEEASRFAEALKFEGVKENLAKVREEMEKTAAEVARLSAPLEASDSIFGDIWGKVTGGAEKATEKLAALRAQAKALQDALNAQNIKARDTEDEKRKKTLQDEIELARIANAEGIAAIDAEHEYRLRKLNERKAAERAANKELVDELIREEDRRWRAAEAKLAEITAKNAKQFQEAYTKAVKSVVDSINSGIFGAGSVGGDVSQVVDALGRIERKIQN